MNAENSIFSTDLLWQQNSYVRVEMSANNAVRICANKEGLRSLAAHFETLANSIESSIIYNDTPGDLEDGSLNFEVQKVQCRGKVNYAHPFELSQDHCFEMAPVLNLTAEIVEGSEIENQYLYAVAPEKRYKYLLHSIKEKHYLWALGNGIDGLTITTCDEKALLIWPCAVYAKAYAQQTQANLVPICLTWDDLYSLGQKGLSNPKAGFFVFATKQNGYLVSIDKLFMDLGMLK